jgi:hypothetical protein
MTITLTREEAQQVLDDLEALTAYIQGIDKGIVLKIQSIETLRARLSAPEPEPVAYLRRKEFAFGYEQVDREDHGAIPVYTAPPQSEPPCKTGSQCIGGKCPQCVVSEPVAWMNESDIGRTDWKVWAHGKPTATMPLYPAPPQREWQSLTDEEREEATGWSVEHIEAKLREKNHG